MKNNLILSIIMLISSYNFLISQNFRGLDRSPMDKTYYPTSFRSTEKIVEITYSRPQLRGRTFSEVVPDDKIWRTGANEATIITVYKQIQIDNHILEPGTYTLFTIPKGNTITVIISKPKSNFNWGTYSYNSDDDILRLNVPLNKDEISLDVFSVAFSANSEQPKIFFGWGLKRFEVPFQVVNWI